LADQFDRVVVVEREYIQMSFSWNRVPDRPEIGNIVSAAPALLADVAVELQFEFIESI